VNELQIKNEFRKIIEKIHIEAPKLNINTEEIASYEVRGGILNKQSIKRIIIYLRSSGCQWMLDEGGCAMCGHYVGTTRGRKISSEDYIIQFKKIVSEIDFSETPMLCVYNAGSFLNDNEMPSKARIEIYKIINEIPEVKHVIFESRPEYVTEERVKELKTYLTKKEIEIGMGIESSNEFIRDVCLNKGFKLEEFKRSLKLLKENEISSLGYILLKPPFLNERDAIKDSVESIKWAFSLGVNVVSLEPVSIQKNTLISLLYDLKQYRPPWIWSVFQVLNEVKNIGQIRIGGFEFFPSPVFCTSNCPECNDMFLKYIEEYNRTNDPKVVDKAINTQCSCKNKWIYEMEKDTTTIDGNIEMFLNSSKRWLNEKHN